VLLERAGTEPELKPELLDTEGEFIDLDAELLEVPTLPVLLEAGA